MTPSQPRIARLSLRSGLRRLGPRQPSDGGARARPSEVGSAPTDAETDPLESPKILLVADEWRSRHGGISTFNRELAVAFANTACEVHVAVPDASREECDEASRRGVTLVTPAPILGIVGKQRLLVAPRFSSEDYYPSVIVGHGRILGPYACAIHGLFFPNAKRLHIVHMDAERLETTKESPPGRSAVMTADERQELEIALAISADLVAGVGPLLAEMIEDAMRGFEQQAPPVVDIRPGLHDWGGTVDPANPPRRRQMLLIARAEDIRSKGIDIAAQAVAQAVERFESAPGDTPLLVVRGVPRGEADEVKQRLDEVVAPRTGVVARPYTPDPALLRRDLWQSRVVLMPSRHEGFGLVALEAIAAGVPVLVSRESGIGRALRETITDGERAEPREVVSVSGDDQETAQVWSEAIYDQLIDPAAAFARAAEVRRQLKELMSWPRAVETLLDGLGLPTHHPA